MVDPTPAPRSPADGPTGPAVPAQPGPDGSTGPTRWRLAAAVVLPIVAVVVLLVLASVVRSAPDPSADAPLALLPVESPDSGSTACTSLLDALPDSLADLPRRTLEDPPEAAVAWGQPPVVFRCGLPDPAELTCSAALQQVDGVAWLPLSSGGQTTYLAVDRSVRVALTLTERSGSGALQEVSDVIAATLPARDVCRAGVLVPTDG